MFGRALAAVILLAAAAVLLIAFWPELFDLEQSPVVAQVVALRALSVAVAVGLAVLLLLFALVPTPVRRFSASLAALLLVFALADAAVLSSRGFGNPVFQAADASSITVMSWNTYDGAPGPARIAKVAIDAHADVVTLPETREGTAVRVAELMRAAGRPMRVLSAANGTISGSRSTSLLISTRLGEYHADESGGTTSPLPSIVAVPDDGTGPTIAAVHPISPVQGEMTRWREGLAWLARLCTRPDLIVAGDFNSTLDHFSRYADGGELGGCHDGALATGNAAVGTWPVRLPALLGSAIDHVMATDGWRFTGMRVIEDEDSAGSDHRPILAQLQPAA